MPDQSLSDAEITALADQERRDYQKSSWRKYWDDRAFWQSQNKDWKNALFDNGINKWINYDSQRKDWEIKQKAKARGAILASPFVGLFKYGVGSGATGGGLLAALAITGNLLPVVTIVIVTAMLAITVLGAVGHLYRAISKYNEMKQGFSNGKNNRMTQLKAAADSQGPEVAARIREIEIKSAVQDASEQFNRGAGFGAVIGASAAITLLATTSLALTGPIGILLMVAMPTLTALATGALNRWAMGGDANVRDIRSGAHQHRLNQIQKIYLTNPGLARQMELRELNKAARQERWSAVTGLAKGAALGAAAGALIGILPGVGAGISLGLAAAGLAIPIAPAVLLIIAAAIVVGIGKAMLDRGTTVAHNKDLQGQIKQSRTLRAQLNKLAEDNPDLKKELVKADNAKLEKLKNDNEGEINTLVQEAADKASASSRSKLGMALGIAASVVALGVPALLGLTLAGPIGLIVVGIVAVTTGIAASYGLSYSKDSKVAKARSEAIEKAFTKIKEASDAIKLDRSQNQSIKDDIKKVTQQENQLLEQASARQTKAVSRGGLVGTLVGAGGGAAIAMAVGLAVTGPLGLVLLGGVAAVTGLVGSRVASRQARRELTEIRTRLTANRLARIHDLRATKDTDNIELAQKLDDELISELRSERNVALGSLLAAGSGFAVLSAVGLAVTGPIGIIVMVAMAVLGGGIAGKLNAGWVERQLQRARNRISENGSSTAPAAGAAVSPGAAAASVSAGARSSSSDLQAIPEGDEEEDDELSASGSNTPDDDSEQEEDEYEEDRQSQAATEATEDQRRSIDGQGVEESKEHEPEPAQSQATASMSSPSGLQTPQASDLREALGQQNAGTTAMLTAASSPSGDFTAARDRALVDGVDRASQASQAPAGQEQASDPTANLPPPQLPAAPTGAAANAASMDGPRRASLDAELGSQAILAEEEATATLKTMSSTPD